MAETTEAEADTPAGGPPEAGGAPEAGGPAGTGGEASGDAVWLDRVGEVQPVWAGTPATIVTVGLPTAPLERLAERDDCTLINDLARAGEADAVLVSTRLGRAEIAAAMAALRARASCPVVALVHAGGERRAVEIMRAGGTGVLAEGNEEALRAFLSGTTHDTSLVETYERQFGRNREGKGRADTRDAATQLPAGSSFEQRLADLGQSDDAPRVALLRVLGLAESDRRLSPAAVALLRRRLAASYRQLVRSYDADLFSLTETDFAVLGPALSPNRAEQLGARLARITETFAPHHVPLALAMGHAGPEVATEVTLLHELAQRALDAATMETRGSVVSADTLSLGLSSSTELQAATRLLEFAEQHDAVPPGHGRRVAAIAAELARELGYEGAGYTRIQLAAHLHDIGKAGLPAAAMAGPEGLDGEMTEAYRSHAVRGAEFLRVSGGGEVADAVRAHHEHWDGSGYPDGLSGHDIPMGARIIAVADLVDEEIHRIPGDGDERDLADRVTQTLEAAAGTRLDPELVEVGTSTVTRLLRGR